MIRKNAALTALGMISLAGAAYGAAQSAPQDQPARPAEVHPAAKAPGPDTEPSKLPNNTNPDGSLKVVVHHDTTAAESHDGRTDMGGWHISTPDARTVTMVHGRHHDVVVAGPRADGAVVMPDNTGGPGEPMWVMRERQQAELKILQSNADLARRDADRARPTYNDYTYPRDILAENASFGQFDLGGLLLRGIGAGGGGVGGFGWGGPVGFGHFQGLRGPVTTTVIRDDQLGASAQREFNRAAMPRNDGSQDARDAAVRRFGNDSLPRNGATQDAVDRAHTNANKERPAPPPPQR